MPRTDLKVLAALYVPAIAVLAAVALAAISFQMPVGNLTRDVATLAGVNPMTGVLSNLGILLWAATASVSLFAAALAWRRAETRQALFLACFAGLTLVLLFDDFFLFHDYILPAYLGLRERYVMLAYLILTAGLLSGFRNEIFEGDFFMLGLALCFFAVSVGFDRVHFAGNARSWLFLAEDGAKFLGIVSWSGYFIRHSYAQVAAAAVEEPAPAQAPAEEEARAAVAGVPEEAAAEDVVAA